jgi:hypothetical protein
MGMALVVSNESQEGNVSNFYTAKIVVDAGGPGTGLILSPGFIPRQIELWNSTDAASHEWFDPMPAASAKKTVTAGTLTYIVANGITVGASAAVGNGTTVPGEGQFFIDPALIPASKTVYVKVLG